MDECETFTVLPKLLKLNQIKSFVLGDFKLKGAQTGNSTVQIHVPSLFTLSYFKNKGSKLIQTQASN